MFSAYYYLYGTLVLLLASYIPAMIAAGKEKSFVKWYFYGVILLPVAFVHSLILGRPQHRINIFTHNEKNPTARKKKSYPLVPAEKKKITITPTYLYMVFFSKMIFGAFVAVSVFAIFRTVVHGTDTLILACVVFAVLFSVMLSVVEICQLSKVPRVADEITKRALIMIAYSVVCSLPLYLLKRYVVDSFLSDRHADFTVFMFGIISLVGFVALLLRRQRVYYNAFNSIFDYCMLSLSSYAIYAAITLVWMSLSGLRPLIYAVAMPTQLFNFGYFDSVEVIRKSSSIYSSALVHLCVAVVLLVSGLLCQSYKRKEMEFRVEYRSKAFRMSRKRILRRHIPNIGMNKKINKEEPQLVG